MTEGKEFIEQLLLGIMDDIKKDMRAKGQYASGATERLWEIKMIEKPTELEGQLWGPSYLMALITGRGPTRSGGGGGPTLQQKLREWIDFKGIGGTDKEKTSISWAMAKVMHEKGNVLHRTGADTGLLKNNITDSRILAAVDSFTSSQIDKVMSEINPLFK